MPGKTKGVTRDEREPYCFLYSKFDVEFSGNALNFSVRDLSSDAADIELEHRVGRTSLKLGYYWPMSILSGVAHYDTIWGYGKNASYLMERKQIGLKPGCRQVNVVANMTLWLCGRAPWSDNAHCEEHQPCCR